jgi:arginyl-tRNA synthetase
MSELLTTLSELQAACAGVVARWLEELGLDVEPPSLALEPPKRVQFGDLAMPTFPLARAARMAPPKIAAELAPRLAELAVLDRVEAAGPYLNLHLEPRARAALCLGAPLDEGAKFGHGRSQDGQTVLVEFSSPNANKPLHLGHVRNNILGDVVARLVEAQGARVIRTNLINDKGVHICKAMEAWRWREDAPSPESTGLKGDHLVGQLYVEFSRREAAEQERATAELEGEGALPQAGPERERAVNARCPSVEAAREMLVAWEAGDAEVRAQWERMTAWVLEGFEATYRRQGIEFDRLDRESQTYSLGREIVDEAQNKGVAQRREDG